MVDKGGIDKGVFKHTDILDELEAFLEEHGGKVEWSALPPHFRAYLKAHQISAPVITFEHLTTSVSNGFGGEGFSQSLPRSEGKAAESGKQTAKAAQSGKLILPHFAAIDNDLPQPAEDLDFDTFADIVREITKLPKSRIIPLYVLYRYGKLPKAKLEYLTQTLSKEQGLSETTAERSVREVINNLLYVNYYRIKGDEYIELSTALLNDINDRLKKKQDEELEKELTDEDLAERFARFLNEYHNQENVKLYHNILTDLLTLHKSRRLVIDLSHVEAFSPELAEFIIEHPGKAFEVAQRGLKKVLEEEFFKKDADIIIAFKNANEPIKVREVSARHFGKLVTFRGIISGVVSKRKQFYERMSFQCKDCGHEMVRIQDPIAKVEVPSACEKCGSRNLKIDPENSQTRDVIFFSVQDLVEDLQGNEQPARLAAYILDPDVKIAPGDRVIITAVIKDTSLMVKSQLTELIAEVSHIEHIDEQHTTQLSDSDKQRIEELAKRYGDDLPDAISRSIAPEVFADPQILPEVYYFKKAVAYAIASPKRLDNTKQRLWVNVLVVGDKGTGKSTIIKDIKNITIAEYGDGGHFTAAGLIGTVEKDDISKEWIFRGGLMVRANGKVLALDEFEKAKPDDLAKMHTAMAQGEVHFSKATITTTLKTAESVVAAANPVGGVFSEYKDVFDQIPLPSSLLDRFDLIFIFRQRMDDKALDATLEHLDKVDKGLIFREIDEELLKKFFIYIDSINPELTDEALTEIKNFVKKVNKALANAGFKYSMRLRGIIKRLAIANARLRLSNRVELKDVLAAEQVFTAALMSWSGELDWEVLGELELHASKETAELLEDVLDVMKELHKYYTRIPENEAIDMLKEKKGLEIDAARYALAVAKEKGLIREDGEGRIYLASRE